MTPLALKEAISEAERFLRAAKVARSAFNEDGWVVNKSATAAAKRASLDLTKALAAMRRPR